MTLDPRREQEIRERLERVTKWPWSNDGYDDNPGDKGWSIVGMQPAGHVAYCLPYNRNGEADADFIAHAPEDVACLLDEVGRLRDIVSQLQGRLIDNIHGVRRALFGSSSAVAAPPQQVHEMTVTDVAAQRAECDRLALRVSELEGMLAATVESDERG